MLVDDGLTPFLSSPTCLCSLTSCLTYYFGREAKAGLSPLSDSQLVTERTAHVTSHTLTSTCLNLCYQVGDFLAFSTIFFLSIMLSFRVSIVLLVVETILLHYN